MTSLWGLLSGALLQPSLDLEDFFFVYFSTSVDLYLIQQIEFGTAVVWKEEFLKLL